MKRGKLEEKKLVNALSLNIYQDYGVILGFQVLHSILNKYHKTDIKMVTIKWSYHVSVLGKSIFFLIYNLKLKDKTKFNAFVSYVSRLFFLQIRNHNLINM